jgi:hypothetical protein
MHGRPYTALPDQGNQNYGIAVGCRQSMSPTANMRLNLEILGTPKFWGRKKFWGRNTQ